MTPNSPEPSPAAARPLLRLVRSIAAPRDLVFRAWTEPERLAAWWGPRGFSTDVQRCEARRGGALELVMHAPDGPSHRMKATFDEVAPPNRLVFTACALDAAGRAVLEVRTTVTFLAEGQRTLVTVENQILNVLPDGTDYAQGMADGWAQSLERLTDHALSASASDRQIVLSRVVDAPRNLVWRAWTDPQQLAQWWGPSGFSLTTHAMTLAPGGVWRFTMHGPDGHDYANHITFLAVEAPARLHYTQGGGEDFEPGDFEVTTTFEEEPDGRTRITMRTTLASPEARKLVAERYGAIEGGRQHLARLADHLARRSDLATPSPASQPFVITRVLRAPRDLVYATWTQPEHLAEWFGPAGCRLEVRRLEVRPGGVFHYGMHFADGTTMWGKWVFTAIVPRERLEFTVSFADPQGHTARDEHHRDWPLEMASRVTFADHAGVGRGTLVTVEWRALGDDAAANRTFDEGHASMQAGWGGTFAQLEALLARLTGGA